MALEFMTLAYTAGYRDAKEEMLKRLGVMEDAKPDKTTIRESVVVALPRREPSPTIVLAPAEEKITALPPKENQPSEDTTPEEPTPEEPPQEFSDPEEMVKKEASDPQSLNTPIESLGDRILKHLVSGPLSYDGLNVAIAEQVGVPMKRKALRDAMGRLKGKGKVTQAANSDTWSLTDVKTE